MPRKVGRTLDHRLEDKKLVQPSRGGREAQCSEREQGQHRYKEVERTCLPNATTPQHLQSLGVKG